MKTQGLGVQHVACQVEFLKFRDRLPSQVPGWPLSAPEASVSFPEPCPEQAGPHLTSQPRGSGVNLEPSLGGH